MLLYRPDLPAHPPGIDPEKKFFATDATNK